MLLEIRRSMKWKLVLVFISVLLFVVSAIGLFSYYETSRTIRKDVERFSSLILRQVNLNLERYYREYSEAMLQIGTSREFTDWIRVGREEAFQSYHLDYKMNENYIVPFMIRHPEILSVTLKSKQGNEFHHTATYGLEKDYTLDDDWLQDVTSYNQIYVHVQFSDDYLDSRGQRLSMPVMTWVKSFGIFNSGYVKIDVSLQPSQQILSEMELGKQVTGMIADSSGKILVHTDETMILQQLDPSIVHGMAKSSSGAFLRKDTNEMVVYETSPQFGWKTIAIMPFENIARSIYSVRDMTILFAMAGIALGMLLIVAFTSSVTKRLSKLRQTIMQTRIGNFQVRVPVDGVDEVSDLGQAYNRMLEEIEASIHQLTETKLRQREAALSALQSQINSHFLYNTLESINSMASLVDHTDIEETTIALAEMLRYTSSYRDAVVTIDEEINHLQHYFRICSIRYGDGFTYAISVDPGCGDVPCLKAILQPIVENALKHGIEATGEPIHVDVRAQWTADDNILVRIADNGKGFDPSAYEHLRQELRNDAQGEQYRQLTKVGLLNVNYRLKMYYGQEEAGIELEPPTDTGAVVCIRFPARTTP